MSIAPESLADFVGKDVNLRLVGQDEALEGKVEQASPAGIAFKRRGRRDIEPFFPDGIESIEVVEKRPTKIKQKKQLPVADERVKAHLASAHGLTLTEVNALSQEDAVKMHNGIDHTDLGHNHDKEPEAEKSEATESE